MPQPRLQLQCHEETKRKETNNAPAVAAPCTIWRQCHLAYCITVDIVNVQFERFALVRLKKLLNISPLRTICNQRAAPAQVQ